tara:strand:- start:6 stop:536 length:531 start_codon:yes stop_codon:yes gene_type:complete
MYCDLLSIEIQKTRSEGGVVQKTPQVTTFFQPDIGSDYIENMSLRIDYYYRIGSATSVEQLKKIEKELIDVFGHIPDKTKKLLLVASLKNRYKSTPVSQIDIQDGVLKIIVQPFNEEEQLVFLSRIGVYKHKTLESVRFKEVSGGLLGVFLNVSGSGDVFDLLFNFVHLFDPIDTA